MKNVEKIILTAHSTIKEALQIIDRGSVKFAVVVDEHGKLLGTLTDGDIRRAILAGKSLDDSIENVYFRSPTVANIKNTKEEILNLCTSKKIYQIPVVDNSGRVVSIALFDELLKSEIYPNKVVLMAGGLGTRLRPLTDEIPKPMLPVGGKPILQTIIERFVSYGFINIVLCVGYKSNIIQEFFADGRRLGANIEYILEDKRLGTAGALSLLASKPNEPFFVMNGDILTNVNFEHLLEFHSENATMATMCVREYDFQVPYGVVDMVDGKIRSIVEKPIHKFFVSAGIYMLNAETLEIVPNNEFYDMPTLFEELIRQGKNTVPFPIREYWLDIGLIDEYEKANLEYHRVFNSFKA